MELQDDKTFPYSVKELKTLPKIKKSLFKLSLSKRCRFASVYIKNIAIILRSKVY